MNRLARPSIESTGPAVSQLLMVFARNPVLGKVKQRLAMALGAAQALRIYRRLLQHTIALTAPVQVHKWLWYAGGMPQDSAFVPRQYFLHHQPTGHLGARMAHAFDTAFDAGHTHVVLIGSDCLSLTPKHIAQAFEALQSHDCVIGPALDGGYYLLGLRHLMPSLFTHTQWGTDQVCQRTIQCLHTAKASHHVLEPLSDLDHPDQIPPALLVP